MLIKVITQSKLTSQAHLFCFDRPVQKHRELTSLRTELSLNQKEASMILLKKQAHMQLMLKSRWWQPAARSAAEQVRLIAESTRVYGDYFVTVEQCTVDTKTI